MLFQLFGSLAVAVIGGISTWIYLALDKVHPVAFWIGVVIQIVLAFEGLVVMAFLLVIPEGEGIDLRFFCVCTKITTAKDCCCFKAITF